MEKPNMEVRPDTRAASEEIKRQTEEYLKKGKKINNIDLTREQRMDAARNNLDKNNRNTIRNKPKEAWK